MEARTCLVAMAGALALMACIPEESAQGTRAGAGAPCSDCTSGPGAGGEEGATASPGSAPAPGAPALPGASPATDLCAGLVTDKVARPMTAVTKPALGQSYRDPAFGTTVRRVTDVVAQFASTTRARTPRRR